MNDASSVSVRTLSHDHASPCVGPVRQNLGMRPADPTLDPRDDELWLALDRAATVLEAHPEYLHEKKSSWEEGLNSDRINVLATNHGLHGGTVYRALPTFDGDRRVEEHLEVLHPSGRSAVKLLVWSSVYYPPTPISDVTRAAAYLRAWRDDREVQLVTGGRDWLVLDVLEGRLRTTLFEDPDERDRAETQAAKLRSAASQLHLVPLTASNRELATAVRTWLVAERGATDRAAGRMSLLDATGQVRDAIDQESCAGHALLDLNDAGSKFVLNGEPLTYRATGSTGGRGLTPRHGGAVFLVRAALGLTADARNSSIEDVRDALRRAAGGPFELGSAGERRQITPPIRVSERIRTRFRSHVGTAGTSKSRS